MDNQEKREVLKAAGVSVPRSNEDMEKAFDDFQSGKIQTDKPSSNEEIWTYVGQGETPPQAINFMGIQPFMRGKPEKVTDSRVLAKIRTNPCFAKGEIGPDTLIEQDELAKRRAERIRKRDSELESEARRQAAKY